MIRTISLLGLLTLLLMACQSVQLPQEDPLFEMHHPAMQYCDDKGGTIELRETDEGQTDFCVFDDGSACEQWAYLEGGCVSWSEVDELLASGEVKMVFQSHQLDVGLTLADGTQVTAVEPHIDAIFQAVEECGEPCASIALATE